MSEVDNNLRKCKLVCPKPIFWNTGQNVSQGSINSAVMRFSHQIQQNKKRGKVKSIPVTKSGRPPPKNHG